MSDRIEVGDRVNVQWETLIILENVEVISIPCATGDCWQLLAEDGTAYCIINFCLMTRR